MAKKNQKTKNVYVSKASFGTKYIFSLVLYVFFTVPFALYMVYNAIVVGYCKVDENEKEKKKNENPECEN